MNAPATFPGLLREWDAIREDIAFLRALRQATFATANGPLAWQYTPGGAGNVLLDLRSLTASGATPTGGLPSQTGKNGKFLGTDGATASWQTVNTSLSAARLYLSSNQSINNTTTTAIIWSGATYDTGSYFNGGAPTRLTIAATGIYLISVAMCYANNTNNQRVAYITGNGAADLGSDYRSATSGSEVSTPQTTRAFQLFAGDYIEARTWQNSGGSLNVVGDDRTSFSIFRLG